MITTKKMSGSSIFVNYEEISNTGIFTKHPDHKVGSEEREKLFESLLSSGSFGFTHKKSFSSPGNDLGIRLGK